MDEEILEDNESDNKVDSADKIKKLKEKLKSCEVERGEYLDGWQRNKADFANFRKLIEKDSGEAEKRAISRILIDLIPVLVSMDNAKQWTKDLAPIENQLETVLMDYGLIKFGAQGEIFDPNRYESVEAVVVAEKEKDNIILNVISAGYILGTQVIVPAKVKVGVWQK